MTNKFELAEPAKADLKEIWTYLAEFNPAAADKFFRELAKKFQMLADNPQIGHLQNNFIVNLRSFPHKGYTIFYFSEESGVQIHRVLHGVQNVEELFEDYFQGLQP